MIRAFIVDDSALMRTILHDILSADPEIEVVGQASDPYEAWEKVRRLQPDVMTLDVEMPRMDGLSFLEKLMDQNPLPVVMVSSYTRTGYAATLRALELGAIDFVAKPHTGDSKATDELSDEILAKVRTAARVSRNTLTKLRATTPRAPAAKRYTHDVILLAASTGGTEALRTIVTALPADCPPVLVVQHMPENFTRSFAERLDRQSMVSVREAGPTDELEPGSVLIAPGNRHLRLAPGAWAESRTDSEAPVNGHRPSADVLFRSALPIAQRSVAAVLTGMGRDGAQGLLALKEAGAATFAQNRETSVVFGMPGEAFRIGAVDRMVSLAEMADVLIKAASET